MIDRDLNYGRHIISKFLINSMPFTNVLDIGAGRGLDLQLASDINDNVDLFGLEYDDIYYPELESRGINIVSSNLEYDRFPFDDGVFDVVMTNQVLEHVKQVFWILHEVNRVLKMGGNLIIGVPNLASFHNRLLLLFGRHPTSINNASAHVRGYSKSDLKRLVMGTFYGGYVMQGFAGSNFYPFPAFLARPLATIFPGMSWSIFFHFKKIKEYCGEVLDYLENNAFSTDFYRGDA